MRRSHVCLECGGDLRRERARPEPHYGLPMVFCPRCGAVSVRRRHPLEVGLRRLRRIGASLSTLALQLAIFLLLTAFVAVACGEVRPRADLEMALTSDVDAVTRVLLGLVALPIAIGTWLTAGLGHWPRGTAWLAFPLTPLLIIAIRSYVHATDWSRDVLVLVVIMVIALAGIPLGRGLRSIHAAAVRWLWRTRRRLLRQRSLQ